MRNYFKLFFFGVRAQFRKLWKYRHKPGFEEMTFFEAYTRLLDEVEELDFELENPKGLNFEAIRNEAADVANFAHIIILKSELAIKGSK